MCFKLPPSEMTALCCYSVLKKMVSERKLNKKWCQLQQAGSIPDADRKRRKWSRMLVHCLRWWCAGSFLILASSVRPWLNWALISLLYVLRRNEKKQKQKNWRPSRKKSCTVLATRNRGEPWSCVSVFVARKT